MDRLIIIVTGILYIEVFIKYLVQSLYIHSVTPAVSTTYLEPAANSANSVEFVQRNSQILNNSYLFL